jgi:hypothetical protein
MKDKENIIPGISDVFRAHFIRVVPLRLGAFAREKNTQQEKVMLFSGSFSPIAMHEAGIHLS